MKMRLLIVPQFYTVYAASRAGRKTAPLSHETTKDQTGYQFNMHDPEQTDLVDRTDTKSHAVEDPSLLESDTSRITTNLEVPIETIYDQVRKMSQTDLVSVLDAMAKTRTHQLFTDGTERDAFLSIIADNYPLLLIFAVTEINKSNNRDKFLKVMENIDKKDFEKKVFQEQVMLILSNFDEFTDAMQAKLAWGASEATRLQVVQAWKNDVENEFTANIPIYLSKCNSDYVSKFHNRRIEYFQVDNFIPSPLPVLLAAMTFAHQAVCKHIFDNSSPEIQYAIIQHFIVMGHYAFTTYIGDNLSLDAETIHLLKNLDDESYSRAMFIGDNDTVRTMIMQIHEDRVPVILKALYKDRENYRNSGQGNAHSVKLSEDVVQRLMQSGGDPVIAVMMMLDTDTVQLIVNSVPEDDLEKLLLKTSLQRRATFILNFGKLKLSDDRVVKIRGCNPANLIQMLLVLDKDTNEKILDGMTMRQLEDAFTTTKFSNRTANERILDHRLYLSDTQILELVKLQTLSSATIRLVADDTRTKILSRMEPGNAVVTLQNLVKEDFYPTLVHLIGTLTLSKEVVDKLIEVTEFENLQTTNFEKISEQEFLTIATLYILSTPEGRKEFDNHEKFDNTSLLYGLIEKKPRLLAYMAGVVYLPVKSILETVAATRKATSVPFVRPSDFSKLLVDAKDYKFKDIVDYLNSVVIWDINLLFPTKFSLDDDALKIILEKDFRSSKVISRFIDEESKAKILKSRTFDERVKVIDYVMGRSPDVETILFFHDYLTDKGNEEGPEITSQLSPFSLRELKYHAAQRVPQE